MKSLSVVASVLVLVPLTLKGSDCNVSGVAGSGSGALQSSTVSTVDCVASEELGALEWLEAFEVSPEQLEADYQSTIGGGMAGETDNLIATLVRRALEGGELMIPVVFLAEAEEGEGKAEEGAEKDPGAEFNAALGARLTALELENAALKKRLAQLEPSADPVGPFVDPDWPPANVKPRRRFRFIPRQMQRGAATSPIRPIVAVSPYPVRFRPFTRAAMDTQISGRLSRARGSRSRSKDGSSKMRPRRLEQGLRARNIEAFGWRWRTQCSEGNSMRAMRSNTWLMSSMCSGPTKGWRDLV